MLSCLLAFQILANPIGNGIVIGFVFAPFVLMANSFWMLCGDFVRKKVYGGPWHRPVHLALGATVIGSALMVL